MTDLVETRYEGTEQPGIPVFLAKVSQDVLNFDVPGVGNNRGSTRDVTYPFHVISKAKRSGNGLHVRGLFITWVESAPDGYDDTGKLFIPIMRLFLFRRSKLHMGCTYMGQDCIIIGKRPEVSR